MPDKKEGSISERQWNSLYFLLYIMENCLSFCEILIGVRSRTSIPSAIAAIEKINGSVYGRVYIGSSFCGKYFLHCGKLLKESAEEINSFKKSVTLCVPMFSQADLSAAKKLICSLSPLFENRIIDEITVNDYGMLDYVSENFKDIKINLGRLFNKDTRDVRYKEYSGRTHKPDILTIENPVAFEYPVNCIEFDPTNAVLDVSGNKYLTAVYTPYCYATVGNVCEFASTDKEISKKFRPNDKCAAYCMKLQARYSLANGTLNYLKLGRTVYFYANGVKISGAENYREIFQPLDWYIDGGGKE